MYIVQGFPKTTHNNF